MIAPIFVLIIYLNKQPLQVIPRYYATEEGCKSDAINYQEKGFNAICTEVWPAGIDFKKED